MHIYAHPRHHAAYQQNLCHFSDFFLIPFASFPMFFMRDQGIKLSLFFFDMARHILWEISAIILYIPILEIY